MRGLRLFGVLALVVVACSPDPAAGALASAGASASSSAPTVSAAPAQTPEATPVGLLARPATTISSPRWALLRDGLQPGTLEVTAAFPQIDDATPGLPRARLRSTGKTAELFRVNIKTTPSAALLPPQWNGTISLADAQPGTDVVEVIVRLRDGTDAVVGEKAVTISQPEYVVWTLDFEGDTAGPDQLANTAAIADAAKAPMTLMWNPRVWTTTQVSAVSADAMAAWTKARGAKGDEIALHLHAWTDFVRDAGVAPRTVPNWGGRSDGYDVPLTAFDEGETRKLVDRALQLMSDHGFAKPTSFRGGGLFANAANLRAIAAAGFTVDASATPAGVFGQLTLPWTLAKDAQPYRPSRDDANAPGDLPLLEIPDIAGNTFGYTELSITTTIRDDLGMLAPVGQPAAQRRALTFVSHPATIDTTERRAIEALFRAFDAYRYDRDSGPLRFVTLAQLAQAYK